jgi:hypothetical protein
MIYDPSRPLADLSVPSTPTSNPIFVHYPGEFADWRPQGMIWGPNSKVYIGSFSGYGKLGGPLVVWDPATNVIENYPALVKDQSIVSLTRAGNLIVGSTTVRGGGGAHQTQTQAKIFVWDPATKTKTFESVVHPTDPMFNIFALTTAPNGLVYGSADGKLFRFDPKTNQITLTTTKIGTIANSMGVGDDGLLWGANRNAVFGIEPMDGKMIYNIPVPSPVTAGWAIDGKNIYYGAGPDAYRFALPKVEYYTAPLTTYGTGYAPNNTDYTTTKSGYHKAWVRGSEDAHLNLALLKWNETQARWLTVATSTSSTSSDEIAYFGTAGRYMWKITGTKNHRFYIWLERP